jgi:phosphoglycerate dehydrogenase-like enzyme
MRERTPVRRSLLARLPRLRLLVTTGMRNASIDLDATAELGVVVSGTPGSGTATVELTWALILALARQVPAEDAALRASRWQTTVGRELSGRTLAVLGLGRLGSRVAAVGSAFGMHVVAWSQNLTPEAAARAGAELVSRDELFRRADVLTVHLVLSDRTRGLVGADELALMRPTSYVVNTSRGPDRGHRRSGGRPPCGTVAGAGLDVFDTEPLPVEHPVLRAPNTVLTPHLGFVTEDVLRTWYVGAVATWPRSTPGSRSGCWDSSPGDPASRARRARSRARSPGGRLLRSIPPHEGGRRGSTRSRPDGRPVASPARGAGVSGPAPRGRCSSSRRPRSRRFSRAGPRRHGGDTG